MQAISLFSGVGGLDLGLSRAGIETVLQAEIDPWCRAVLERRFPAVERVEDVRDVHRNTIQRVEARCATEPADRRERKQGDGHVDLIHGGFPCQDVSVAGKRAGFRGVRSSLWFEFCRVLSELRPAWTLIENVPGLFSSHSGRDFGTILSGLVDLGYGVAWRTLDAQHFGVPQRRRRVFVVGCPGDANRAAAVLAVCEGCGGDSAAGGEAGQELAYSLAASARGTGDGHGNAWNSTYLANPVTASYAKQADSSDRAAGPVNLIVARPLTARETGYRMDYETENFLVANRIRASDGHHGHSSPRGDSGLNVDISGTLDGNTVEGIAGPQGVRRLTPLECERLMGWPDEWTRWTADGREVPDSVRYRMCGNGVVATVAEWIGWRLAAVDGA